MSAVTYTIPNISCMHCVNTIKRELMDVEGVSGVEADLEKKQITVSYSAPANEVKLKTILTEIYYPPLEN